VERSGRRVVTAASPEVTERLGVAFGQRLGRGALVALVGGLGVGKTVFVRGACRGLGVDEEVLSPTFILLEVFVGRLRVAHLDLFRLEHESEVEALGVFDLLDGDAVVLAEWADRSQLMMASADVVVEIADEGAGRRVTFSYTDEMGPLFEDVASW
jgi:tRNA threonylcarbamoyladenosine biosynthesis protein TsaE